MEKGEANGEAIVRHSAEIFAEHTGLKLSEESLGPLLDRARSEQEHIDQVLSAGEQTVGDLEAQVLHILDHALGRARDRGPGEPINRSDIVESMAVICWNHIFC